MKLHKKIAKRATSHVAAAARARKRTEFQAARQRISFRKRFFALCCAHDDSAFHRAAFSPANFRRAVFSLAVFFAGALLFAQTHASVPVDGKVYEILNVAELRGLCRPLPAIKPYSENIVKNAILEIFASSDASDRPQLSATEEQVLRDVLEKMERKRGLDLQRGGYYFERDGNVRISIDATLRADLFVSTGIYNATNDDQWGFWLTPTVALRGDLGTHLSYDFNLFGIAVRTVLKELGTYEIGSWWQTYPIQSATTNNTTSRKMRSFANNAFFPFSFHKNWDGSVYKLSDLSATGLEGWPDDFALSFGINAEIAASFLEDRLFLRFGRMKREWAAMDEGSSLVLSNYAHPFLAFEMAATPFNWLTFSSLTGILEFPNNDFQMEGGTYDNSLDYTEYDSAAHFQNAYSINMLELNFKYVHFDFGSLAVWPKRFEIGYLFPFMNAVFYQNNIGGFDNIGLFTDLKILWPRVGYVWASLFLDEFVGFNRTSGILGDFVHSVRNMYATQVGMKANIPWLPFASFSMRYTKIEPFCYTHQAFNDTPWYQYYISVAYMNAGESIGYYLPPNSDELNVHFQTALPSRVTLHLNYQFIRHGADYGSQQVRGSSLYSELDPNNRDELKKYFLHDGAYQWLHIVKIGAEWNMKQLKVPLTLYTEAGIVYSYFTVISGNYNRGSSATYTRDDYDNKWHPYRRANTSEYPTRFGGVISTGVKLWF